MNIAILGFGTVGSGVFEICEKNSDINVVKIFDKKEKFDKQHIELFTENIFEILNNKEIDLVVETLGGHDFAKKMVIESLNANKHVVTANKEIVATSLDELTTLAKKHNKYFMYEASVGGGIPIINNLFKIKRFNEITEIKGIINGTTNYILTNIKNGKTFDEALACAQKLGFAEANPTNDVDGFDMARKIAILASIVWDTKIDYSMVETVSLRSLQKENYEFAKNENKTIKYIASCKKINNEIKISVKPVYLDESDILASVNNETNAILVKCIPNDELVFIGKGAGKLATASAIVNDIYDIKHNKVINFYENKNKFEINK